MSADTSNASVERLRREVRPSMPDGVLRLWATDAVAVLGALLAERDAARAEVAMMREALGEITHSYDRDRPRAGRVDNWDSYEEGLRANARIARAALAGGKP